MKFVIPIFIILFTTSCSPIQIRYQIVSENNVDVECEELNKIRVKTYHYQNGSNFLWISLGSNIQIATIDLQSTQFQYIESNKDVNTKERIYIFENLEKIKYERFVEKLKSEQIVLKISSTSILCQDLKLEPILN